jgi:hypothetical protein
MEQLCVKRQGSCDRMQLWVAMIRALLSHKDGLTMSKIMRAQAIARKLARHAIVRDESTNSKDRK